MLVRNPMHKETQAEHQVNGDRVTMAVEAWHIPSGALVFPRQTIDLTVGNGTVPFGLEIGLLRSRYLGYSLITVLPDPAPPNASHASRGSRAPQAVSATGCARVSAGMELEVSGAGPGVGGNLSALAHLEALEDALAPGQALLYNVSLLNARCVFVHARA